MLRNQKSQQQEVTTARFEIEQSGRIAFLEYTVAGNIMAMLHTEVPSELRGKGLAAELAQSAFQYARDHNLRVDVVCPYVAEYLNRHPEYADLVIS